MIATVWHGQSASRALPTAGHWQRTASATRRIALPAFPGCLLVCLLAGTAPAADTWQTRLYLAGTETWHARIPVDLANHSAEPLEGYPAAVTIGQAPGQIDLVRQPARELRVCDRAGTELLFDLRAPDGRRVDDQPIPLGATLTLPVTAAAGETQRLYLYFEHPATWPVPECLEGGAGLVDLGFEVDGEWRHTAVDARHRLARVATAPHTGQSCMRCEVDAGAESRWTTAHQTGIAMRPGRRYRVSAWVKGENVVGTSGWFVHVATATDPMAVSQLVKAGDGTFDWRPVNLEFTAPPGAVSLDTGTILYGTGSAWFDDARLERLDPEPDVTATGGPVERLKLAAPPAQRPFIEGYECRLPVYLINPGDALKGTLVQVRISRLKALFHRGFSAGPLRLVDPAGGAAIPCLALGEDLLFSAAVPARSRKAFDLYFSRDPKLRGGTASSYQSLLDSPANLAKNPSFERGGELPDDWPPVTGGGEKPAEVRRVEGGPFGGHCVRTTTSASGTWTGWSQTQPVEPNTDYVLLCRSRTLDLADHPARLNAHLLDSAGNRQYWSGGPELTGTTDWTLVGGRLHTAADTGQVILYPTTNARGTVEYDGVVFARAVPAAAGEVETRPERSGPEVRAWVEDP
ncbi:MAG: hypothetical protein HYU66_20645, partial [Armatimonadetes bacterium]|nr:hypothetical protein [Armatimonadota bacterium]